MLLNTPHRRRLVISLTPLIDVVFILLVFFMLASSFLDWRSYDVSTAISQKPAAASAERDPSKALLGIDAAGLWQLDGEKLSIAECKAALAQRLLQHPELAVTVQLAAKARLQHGVQALDLMQQLGIKAVSLQPATNVSGSPAADELSPEPKPDE